LVVVFNATFNNISVISWRSVLLVYNIIWLTVINIKTMWPKKINKSTEISKGSPTHIRHKFVFKRFIGLRLV
jgi:predicted MPP superfamily phosphohydrolase